jgi:hypothetical protein
MLLLCEKMGKFYNMPCSYPLVQPNYKVPATLLKSYRLEGISADGSVKTLTVKENHQRFVRHAVDWQVSILRLIPLSTNGAEKAHIFGFEAL